MNPKDELTVMNMSKWRRLRREGQRRNDRSALQIAPFQAKLRHVVHVAHRSIVHRGIKAKFPYVYHKGDNTGYFPMNKFLDFSIFCPRTIDW